VAQHIRESGLTVSPASRVAVRWAAHEATVRNVPLTPVHVVCTPAVSSSALSWPAVPIPAELRQWQEDEAAKVMARSSSSKTAPQKVLGPRSRLLILRRMPFRGSCWKAVEESVAQLGRVPTDGLTPGGVPPRSTSQVVLRSAAGRPARMFRHRKCNVNLDDLR
jgi:Universal stress protein family